MTFLWTSFYRCPNFLCFFQSRWQLQTWKLGIVSSVAYSKCEYYLDVLLRVNLLLRLSTVLEVWLIRYRGFSLITSNGWWSCSLILLKLGEFFWFKSPKPMDHSAAWASNLAVSVVCYSYVEACGLDRVLKLSAMVTSPFSSKASPSPPFDCITSARVAWWISCGFAPSLFST